MKYEIRKISNWLKEITTKAHAEGLVVGVSGGLDSAVVSHLIGKAFPENSIGVIMPIQTNKADYEDALAAVQSANIKHLNIDLTTIHNDLLTTIEKEIPAKEIKLENSQLKDANLRARLRMSTLYTVAANYNYLVVGTDNLSEWYTGYFTKYGDGGVDLQPIAQYTKTEIYEMAKILNVPESILYKKPSADLWEGQTDEEEMGTTYEAIDAYLTGEKVAKKDRQTIKKMHQQTEHKRNIPPIYIREKNKE